MLLRFIRWAGLVYGTWYKIVNDRMGVRRARGQNRNLPPALKLGLWNKYFWKKMKSASFRLIDLILAMTVFLPVWNSHCTRVRFTIIVSCSDELAFPHVPSFACRGGVRKSRADCSTVGLYCVIITWQQICKGSLCILWQAFCCMRLLNAHILAGNAARQWPCWLR